MDSDVRLLLFSSSLRNLFFMKSVLPRSTSSRLLFDFRLLLSIITFGVSGILGGDQSLDIVGSDLDLRRREGIDVSEERSVILLADEGSGVCLGKIMSFVVLVVVIVSVGVWAELVLTLLTLVLTASVVVFCGKLIVCSWQCWQR